MWCARLLYTHTCAISRRLLHSISLGIILRPPLSIPICVLLLFKWAPKEECTLAPSIVSGETIMNNSISITVLLIACEIQLSNRVRCNWHTHSALSLCQNFDKTDHTQRRKNNLHPEYYQINMYPCGSLHILHPPRNPSYPKPQHTLLVRRRAGFFFFIAKNNTLIAPTIDRQLFSLP